MLGQVLQCIGAVAVDLAAARGEHAQDRFHEGGRDPVVRRLGDQDMEARGVLGDRLARLHRRLMLGQQALDLREVLLRAAHGRQPCRRRLDHLARLEQLESPRVERQQA